MAEDIKTPEDNQPELTAAAAADSNLEKGTSAQGSKKNKLRLVLGVIVVVLIIVGGYSYYQGTNYVSTDDAVVSSDTPTVSVVVPFAGRLASWNVKVNDQVNQGQVIGELSNQSVLALNTTVAPIVSSSTMLTQRLLEMEKVRSPISGVVVQSNVALGQGVQPGQVLAQVVNQDHLQVTANVFETDVRKIHVGQTVTMTVDGLPGVTLQGSVARIANNTESVFSLVPNVTAASGTYTKVAQRVPVYIDFKDASLAKQTLVPGMSVVVKIHIQ